jgi:hypothetical protein
MNTHLLSLSRPRCDGVIDAYAQVSLLSSQWRCAMVLLPLPMRRRLVIVDDDGDGVRGNSITDNCDSVTNIKITIATDNGIDDNDGNDMTGNDDDVDGNGATDGDIDNDDCDNAMDGDYDDDGGDGVMDNFDNGDDDDVDGDGVMDDNDDDNDGDDCDGQQH